MLCVGLLLAACQGGDRDAASSSATTSARRSGGNGFNGGLGSGTESPIQSNPANPGGVPNGGLPGAGFGGPR